MPVAGMVTAACLGHSSDGLHYAISTLYPYFSMSSCIHAIGVTYVTSVDGVSPVPPVNIPATLPMTSNTADPESPGSEKGAKARPMPETTHHSIDISLVSSSRTHDF